MFLLLLQSRFFGNKFSSQWGKFQLKWGIQLYLDEPKYMYFFIGVSWPKQVAFDYFFTLNRTSTYCCYVKLESVTHSLIIIMKLFPVSDPINCILEWKLLISSLCSNNLSKLNHFQGWGR